VHFTFMVAVLSTILGVYLGMQEESKRWEPHIANIILAIFLPWILGMIVGAFMPQVVGANVLDLGAIATGGILGYVVGVVTKYIKEKAFRF